MRKALCLGVFLASTGFVFSAHAQSEVPEALIVKRRLEILRKLEAEAESQRSKQAGVLLSEVDLTRFMNTIRGLRAVGIETAGAMYSVPAGVDAKAIAASPQAVRVLEANGFTPERYQDVTYSIGMALSAGKMSEEELAVEDGQFGPLPEPSTEEELTAAFEAQRRRDSALRSVSAQLRAQPAANVALVTKHRAALDAAIMEDLRK